MQEGFARLIKRLLLAFVAVVLAIMAVLFGGACLFLFSRPAPSLSSQQTYISPAVPSAPAVAPAGSAPKRSEPAPSHPDKTWVDGYTRKDGTKVKGHWRKLD